MREDYTTVWAIGIRGALESSVHRNFPQDLRNWPLLKIFEVEAYELPNDYIAFIFRDRLTGMPIIPSLPKPFPYSDHPTLPPQVDDIDLWQFYFRDKFDLREEDAAFLVPVRDSGKDDVQADYELFTPEERMFWNLQIAHVIARYKAYLQSLNEQQQSPSNTYIASGPNARVLVNATDSSYNVINAEASEVFDKLRGSLAIIEDDVKRQEIATAIDNMESAYGSDDFQSRYKEFMALLADHVTVFAPFLPALANLLG